MFGFLKKKIKETSEKIAEEIEEEASVVDEKAISEEEKEVLEEEEKEVKKGFFKKLFSKKKKEDEIEEDSETEEKEQEKSEEETKEISKEKKEPVKEKKDKPEIIEEKKEITEEKPTQEKEEVIDEEKKEITETKEEPKTTEEPIIEEKESEIKEQSAKEIAEEKKEDEIEKVKEEEIEIKTLSKKQVPEDEVHITYFVHGTTIDNEKEIASGHSDADLSKLGIQQAKELKNLLKYEFDVIFTSDLTRATHSADLTWPNKEKIVDKRLRECNYGKLNSGNKEEHKAFKKDYNPIYENYSKGESYNDVTLRIRKFLNDLYKKYKGKHVAIVAHRYSQLAIEVLLNNKSWTQALEEDWRLKQNWQPGWEYKITQKVEKHIEKKKDLLKETSEKPEKEPKLETKETTEEPIIEEIEEQKTEKIEQQKEKITEIKEEIIEEKPESKEKKKEKKIIDPTKSKKNIFKKLSESITKLNITNEKFEELFWDLEIALLENNVALEVIEKIKDNLKQELESTKITRKSINDIILNNLKQSIESLFDYEQIDLINDIKSKKEPYIILMLGVNGSGKTTSISKLIQYFKDNNLSTVVSASDTFRAAAIQQIEEHTNKLNTKLIKQDYGADPAAVAYDAIEHAKAKNTDVVLIDTAGRLHSNSNLMQELNKIIKVANPDMKIFIGESITGNDCVEQAKQFDETVGIDGIILTKADIDEKGGAAISISYVTKKPILFITTGQEYKDIKVFNSQEIIDSIFTE